VVVLESVVMVLVVMVVLAWVLLVGAWARSHTDSRLQGNKRGSHCNCSRTNCQAQTRVELNGSFSDVFLRIACMTAS
jgi:hypothetical protein